MLDTYTEEVKAELHLNGTQQQVEAIMAQFDIPEVQEPTKEQAIEFTRLDVEQAIDSLFE